LEVYGLNFSGPRNQRKVPEDKQASGAFAFWALDMPSGMYPAIRWPDGGHEP
jgi:hypothetical protein